MLLYPLRPRHAHQRCRVHAVRFTGRPVVTSAQNGAIAPTPAPAGRTGGPIDVTVDYANALAAWQPPVARAAQLAATGDSNSDSNTWYEDCAGGTVNPAASGGWCWVPQLKLFYNLESKVFLDPFSNRLMLLNPSHSGLVEVIRTDDDTFQPPAFVRPGAQPPPLSSTCSAEQQRLARQHAAGLRTNAAHADSQIMQARFTNEAKWWEQLCAP